MKITSMVLTLFWGLILSSSALAGEQRLMTLEDIPKISSVSSIATSPNGKWVAYTKSVQRTPYKDADGPAWGELHLTDTKGNSRPFISGKVNIASLKWSDDSKKLYYLAKRNDDKFSSLYSIPVDGGESTRVYGHKSDIVGFDLKGDKAAVITLQPASKHQAKLIAKGFQAKVYEEQLKYNQVHLVDLSKAEDNSKQLSVDGHVFSIEFNHNGSGMVAEVSPTPLIDDIYMLPKVVVLDDNGGKQAALNGDGKVGHGEWSPNGKDIAYIGSADTHDPAEGIIKYRTANGKTTELQPGLMGHSKDLEFLPKGDLLVLNHIGTGSEVVILNPRKPGKSTKMKTGNRIVRSLSAPAKGRGFAFIADTPSHPREAFWYQGGKVTRLSNSNPWLADIKLGKQESITWKAKDGTEVQGVLTYPVDYKKGKRYPLINFIHGGPEAHISNGWHMRYSEPVHVAAGKGYFTLYPNYRSSTGRGLAFSKAGQGDYAVEEFRDIVAGKDYLVEKGMVDPNKVGITGGSYGGYATAWSSTVLSEHYQAAVMFVGISNQLSKFGTTDIPNEMHLVHALTWPWEKFQWMLERSPIYHAEKHRTPLLIMHGEADPRVHPGQSLEMYRYLKTLNNAPVRLVLYPGEGHGNRKAAGQYDYSLRLMRWMDHYLMGPGGKPPEQDLKHEEKLDDSDDHHSEETGNDTPAAGELVMDDC